MVSTEEGELFLMIHYLIQEFEMGIQNSYGTYAYSTSPMTILMQLIVVFT